MLRRPMVTFAPRARADALGFFPGIGEKASPRVRAGRASSGRCWLRGSDIPPACARAEPSRADETTLVSIEGGHLLRACGPNLMPSFGHQVPTVPPCVREPMEFDLPEIGERKRPPRARGQVGPTGGPAVTDRTSPACARTSDDEKGVLSMHTHVLRVCAGKCFPESGSKDPRPSPACARADAIGCRSDSRQQPSPSVQTTVLTVVSLERPRHRPAPAPRAPHQPSRPPGQAPGGACHASWRLRPPPVQTPEPCSWLLVNIVAAPIRDVASRA
jgi:hypothetical protein